MDCGFVKEVPVAFEWYDKKCAGPKKFMEWALIKTTIVNETIRCEHCSRNWSDTFLAVYCLFSLMSRLRVWLPAMHCARPAVRMSISSLLYRDTLPPDVRA